MTHLLPGAGKPFTGRHMLLVVGLFFGTIIAVNLVMAYAAVSTFPGLNARNGYVASQTYNALLKEAARQAERGWTATLGLKDGRLALSLADRSGAAVRGLHVSALAGRPANASTDRLLALRPAAGGYEAEEALAAGRWLVEVEARDGGPEGPVVWRETRPLVAP